MFNSLSQHPTVDSKQQSRLKRTKLTEKGRMCSLFIPVKCVCVSVCTIIASAFCPNNDLGDMCAYEGEQVKL